MLFQRTCSALIWSGSIGTNAVGVGDSVGTGMGADIFTEALVAKLSESREQFSKRSGYFAKLRKKVFLQKNACYVDHKVKK